MLMEVPLCATPPVIGCRTICVQSYTFCVPITYCCWRHDSEFNMLWAVAHI